MWPPPPMWPRPPQAPLEPPQWAGDPPPQRACDQPPCQRSPPAPRKPATWCPQPGLVHPPRETPPLPLHPECQPPPTHPTCEVAKCTDANASVGGAITRPNAGAAKMIGGGAAAISTAGSGTTTIGGDAAATNMTSGGTAIGVGATATGGTGAMATGGGAATACAARDCANPERGRCHVNRWWRHVDRRRHDDRRSNKYAGAPDTTPTPATAPTTVMNVPAANPTEATTALTTAPALMASAIVPAPTAPAVVSAMRAAGIRAGMHRHEPGCQRKHRCGPDDATFRPDHVHCLREPVTPTHMVVGYGETVVWHSGNSQFAMIRRGSKLCCAGSAGKRVRLQRPIRATADRRHWFRSLAVIARAERVGARGLGELRREYAPHRYRLCTVVTNRCGGLQGIRPLRGRRTLLGTAWGVTSSGAWPALGTATQI